LDPKHLWIFSGFCTGMDYVWIMIWPENVAMKVQFSNGHTHGCRNIASMMVSSAFLPNQNFIIGMKRYKTCTFLWPKAVSLSYHHA
jgi:hypothetical protein